MVVQYMQKCSLSAQEQAMLTLKEANKAELAAATPASPSSTPSRPQDQSRGMHHSLETSGFRKSFRNARAEPPSKTPHHINISHLWSQVLNLRWPFATYAFAMLLRHACHPPVCETADVMWQAGMCLLCSCSERACCYSSCSGS